MKLQIGTQQLLLLLIIVVIQLSYKCIVNSEREVVYKFNELRKAENDIGNSTKSKKYIALTFDDGPHQVLTPKLLDIAKAKGAIFTFYMMGIIIITLLSLSFFNHMFIINQVLKQRFIRI